MLKTATPLTADVEELIHDVIGCCIRVNRELGPGLLERIYCRAIAIELELAGLSFEQEKRFDIVYRGHVLSDHRLDLVSGPATRPRHW